MQVILLERVPKLGQMGQVVNVKPGFARNFLIPQGKALRASERTLTDFERRRVQLEANNLKAKEEAQRLAAQVDGRSATILRQASETANLYGSVSARDVAKAFTDEGVTLDRGQIRLEEPIKALGTYLVEIDVFPEVRAAVKTQIVPAEGFDFSAEPDVDAVDA